jgi:hypothetical protein
MESLIVMSTPYILIGMAAAFVGAIYMIQNAPTDVIGGVVKDVLMIGFIVYLVMIFVASVSMMIHPWEQFVDMDVSGSGGITKLLADITAAEKDVCDLITRTDKFIQNDVGKPGHDNPQLVTDAQQKARAAVGGPLTDCDASWQLDISGEAALQEADNRITRMEGTLASFTGPELQATYNKTVPCQAEGFMDMSDLNQRLAAVKQTIATQQQKLLKPVDDKTAALQRGEVSDCDKKRGGNVAVTGKPA